MLPGPGQHRPCQGVNRSIGPPRFSDDAHSGNDDDWPAEFIAWCCHDLPVSPRLAFANIMTDLTCLSVCHN
jgi:hypothetical protein